MVPVVDPFIASLKVKLNESPASRKSVLPTLLTSRASTIVGGEKSPAPPVNDTEAGTVSVLLTVSWISPVASLVQPATTAVPQIVTVYDVSALMALERTMLKDVS